MKRLPTRELERRLIYAVIVAGKSAKFTEGAMQRLGLGTSDEPFRLVRRWIGWGQLDQRIREARTGNYMKLNKALRQMVGRPLNLRTCSPEQLEQIHGIGPKTSRFFIIWTRPNARFAALDVHVLRWLRQEGHPAPLSTPTGKRYLELEKVFLHEADLRRLSPRELDARIWDDGSKRK